MGRHMPAAARRVLSMDDAEPALLHCCAIVWLVLSPAFCKFGVTFAIPSVMPPINIMPG